MLDLCLNLPSQVKANFDLLSQKLWLVRPLKLKLSFALLRSRSEVEIFPDQRP